MLTCTISSEHFIILVLESKNHDTANSMMLWKYLGYVLRVWGYLSFLTNTCLLDRLGFTVDMRPLLREIFVFCYQLLSCSLWVFSHQWPTSFFLSRSIQQPLTPQLAFCWYKFLLLVCTSHASSTVLMLGPAWDEFGITKCNGIAKGQARYRTTEWDTGQVPPVPQSH